ncbi:MAG: DNA adenine methylase [Oscillospiraceae bacterium]
MSIIENKDCLDIIRERDGPDSLIYCDPPYFDAESLYAVDFPTEKHEELHWILSQCRGYIVVSYNDCPFIRSLYGDFFILAFRRNNPLSQKPGATYGELIITNYDPRPYIQPQFSMFPAEIENGDLVLVHEPACGSLRKSISEEGDEHETDKNDAPAGAGGEAGNGCEMSAGMQWLPMTAMATGRRSILLTSRQMSAAAVLDTLMMLQSAQETAAGGFGTGLRTLRFCSARTTRAATKVQKKPSCKPSRTELLARSAQARPVPAAAWHAIW